MAKNEVYDEYKVIDKGFSLIEEYWSNIIDAAAGSAKEFSSLRAKDIYKGSAQERLAIDQSVKIFKDASQRAIEFAGKAERLDGQGKESLKNLFENVSKSFSEQAQSIKNSESFHRDLKQTKTAYISEKHWKLAAKGADKLGPAATFIDLGIRASKGDFSGVASGALGAVAGLGFIAVVGATGGWAILAAIAAAGIGVATDKGLKKFFDYMIFDYLGLGHIDDETNKNFNDAHGFTPRIDPLAIDLNGDGVQTISIDSGVLFDFNEDQMRTGTGWLDANDGFLVYDRNGNGLIDNGGELFGVDTRKSDGSLAKDGFDALRDLDSNGDGIFNAEDTEFANVKIWQDKNSDGISQANELRTLDELGITAINLDSQETNIDSNGNRIAATGTVEFADGSTSTAANLDLSANPFYREFTDTVEIGEEIAALPDMQGSGAVRDLREAASQSTELAQLLEQYAGSKTYAEQRALLDSLVSAWAKSSNYANLFDRLESLSSGKAGEPKAAFMHSWLMQLREPNASELAQYSLLEKIAILEAFNGRDFYNFTLQENGSLHIAAGSNISSTIKPPVGKDVIVTETHLILNIEQGALLDKAYQKLLDSVYEALLPQTRLKPYLNAVSLKWDGTDIGFDYSAVIQQLNSTSQDNAVEAVLLGFELKHLLDDTEFDQVFRAERPKWISSLDSEQFTELNKYINSPWFSNKNNESIYIGTNENDTLRGNVIESSELYGGAGNDVLRAGYSSKENLLVGGKGNDTLYGSYGADTYLFNLGDGKDQIFETGGYNGVIDTLRFGEGIRPEDISTQRDGNDFLFIHKNGNDQVRIKNIFNGGSVKSEKIVEHITFTDGTLWTWNQIASQGIISYANDNEPFHGLSSNDIIYGSAGEDVIYGHNGDDVIYGGEGNDILDGGLGSNQLYGGSGNDVLRVDAESQDNILVGGLGHDSLYGSRNADTYVFHLGDGKDQIFEQGSYYSNAIDTLSFGDGIRPEDIKIQREGNDFLFIHNNGTDQVRIKDIFDDSWINSEKVVEQVRFADGTVWNWDQLVSQVTVLYAAADGSTLHGLQGNDIIYGNVGDDILYGYEGDDVIYGGDGNDIIDGGEGSNQLYGGAGNDILRVDNYSYNNLLAGGKGDDILIGSNSMDSYVFNLGDGKDQIFNPSNYYYNTPEDILRFSEGIRPEDISMRREGDDFIFIHSNGSDQVLIKNVFAIDDSYYSDFFDSWIYSGQMVGQVIFADGTTWNWQKLKQHTIISYADNHGNILKGWDGNDILYGNAEDNEIYGRGGDDIIHGGEGNDYIDGGTGNNQLYGDAGDDILTVDIQSENNTLAGGTGNDILQGSFYADTYVFNRGDGQDTIVEHGYNYYMPEVPLDIEETKASYDIAEDDYNNNEQSFNEGDDVFSEENEWATENNSWETKYGDNAIDKLVFGEGIHAEDLWFEQQDQDLMVKIIGTDDQLLIQNWYEGKAYRIEEFHTADGRILLEAEVNKMVQAMAAFAPQTSGESNLTAIPREQLDSVIAVHWQ